MLKINTNIPIVDKTTNFTGMSYKHYFFFLFLNKCVFSFYVLKK